MEIALKIVSHQLNPVQLTFLRFLIGSVVLSPLAIKSLKDRNYRIGGKDITFFALSGFAGVVVSMILFQMAIQYSPASIVAVLISCNSVFVVLFASFLLHEKVHNYTIVSVLAIVAGMFVFINPLHVCGSVAGYTLGLLSAAAFGLYGVMGRAGSTRYGGIALTCGSFAMGCVEMLALILLSNIGDVAHFLTQRGLAYFADIPIWRGMTIRLAPSLLYIGVGVTGLGYAFYFLAMEMTSATTGSLVFFIKPALAPFLALLILHEAITAHMGMGIALILAGSLISFVPSFCDRKTRIRMAIFWYRLVGSETFKRRHGMSKLAKRPI